MVRIRAMTSEEYRAKHESFKIIYGFHPTFCGNCLLGVTDSDKTVVYLAFVDKSQEEALAELKNDWPLSELTKDNMFETEEIVRKIFSPRGLVGDHITVLLLGTEFQIKVWRSLLSIPVATTVTYEQVASMIDHPKAARAVGNAVMKNKIAYLIPCHRVKGKSGSNKYKWGTDRKENILMSESNYL
ncbi:bifunctional transcriptional activator/DNA repair enzyme Ada [Hylaeus volcanicus]|uniref:bifunctional transcriptional activator/DNA repair enzyme Ada n=1 Tax=Hylaeus volcanicus TaxID=313075 RepID=UPI0023B83700|nr:bifunctional transcriptional activator/DNA repair enzyme Ada [Hylaeus volcanicus]